MTEQPPAENRNGRIVTFYSYKGGTGRTMAVANVAWILAANGHRVLAVDWDLEAPGLDLFFRPFLNADTLAQSTGVIDIITGFRDEAVKGGERLHAWYEPLARVRPHAVPVAGDLFGEGGSLDFLSAGQTNSNYSATLGGIDWVAFYDDLGGGDFFQALRVDMRRCYDYVLIDSRTGLSDSAEICTVDMPDDLVVCFTLTNQSIDGASRVSNLIARQYGNRNIRILPVPMRIDKGEGEKVRAGKNYARKKFAGLPHGRSEEAAVRYWNSVEIPYLPYYAFEEILAAFGDEPGLPTTLLSAFERLTAELTEGRVAALPRLGEDVRLGYVEAFRHWLPDTPPVSDVLLSYAAEDDTWAVWVAHVLRSAGHRVRIAEVTSAADPWQGMDAASRVALRTVVILSTSFVRLPQAVSLWESVTAYDPLGEGRRLIPIAIAELRAPEPFNNRTAANISRASEAEARTTVLDAVGGAVNREAEPSSGAQPRFPGAQPTVWSLGSRTRNRLFTGRAEILQRLRAQFEREQDGAPVPQVLYGLSGVGKTQVAMEYAFRFGYAYDLVWWIDAEQSDRVPVSLADLAEKLGLRVGESVADAAQAARDALRRGQPLPRWLLIFDNADDPDEIAGYFPSGSGHILVTSRNQAWSTLAEPQEVEVFTREESIEHLSRHLSGLRRKEAEQVAEAVGDLPLAIDIAAAWLLATGTPVADYVVQLADAALDALAVPVNLDYVGVFGRAWDISLGRLREQSPSAVRLLEISAYFSADEIPRELLESDRMIEALELAEPELRGRKVVRAAIDAIGRFGLAKVDPVGGTLQVHRMVQAMLRSKLSPEEGDAAMHVVHDILVERRPNVDDADDPKHWPAFERIWPHLGPSAAVTCDYSDTRDLLLDRVRYLWKRGELLAAENLALQLEEAWQRKLGADARQTLFLRSQLANVLRNQGRIREAWNIDRETLEKQKRQLGGDDMHTLITTRNLAADLRALGRFQEALELDRKIIETMRGDEDNPQLLSTVNNLALDYRCTGDYQRARELDEETLRRRDERLGSSHPYTLTSKAALAEDLRALGDYQGSLRLLEEFREEYGSVPVMDLPSLRYAKSLAVTLRQMGKEWEARNITSTTYDRLRKSYGDRTPDTLACALNLAADYSATGESERARTFTGDVLRDYRDELGAAHPFTLACEVNLTIYQRDSGRLEQAIELGERAAEAMEQALGADHPFTLTARLNLANSYGEDGNWEQSVELGRMALSGLSARYGPQHPDAVICQANLAVALREAGQEAEAEELHKQAMDELVAQLGPKHTATRSCRHWKRLGLPLELHPL
jgi:tetratricopeptide (TPR) repeat protein